MSSYEIAEVKELLRKGVSPNKIAGEYGFNPRDVHQLAEDLKNGKQ